MNRTKHNNIEYYNSLIKNCNSSKKASEYLKKELDIINERLTENSTDKDALVEKMTLLNDLISQQNYINRYDDFINNMQIRADNQLSFSIFAEPDSFAYNNIQQTPLDFQHLKGVGCMHYYKQNYRVLQIWKRTIDYPPLFAYYL